MMFCMKSRSGFFLIEFLLSLLISSIFLAPFLNSFLLYQSYINRLEHRQVLLQELMYMDTFLHFDLLQLTPPMTYFENGFQFKTSSGDLITYSLVNHYLRRQQNSHSYHYLSKLLLLNSIQHQETPLPFYFLLFEYDKKFTISYAPIP